MKVETCTESEKKMKEELQQMFFTEIKEKIYQYRKIALLDPTKENIDALKKYTKFIKEELGL